MKKRGQAGEVIKYVIIAAIIITVTFFGYSSIVKISDKLCDNELIKFEIDLKDLGKAVKHGSVKEFM